jgi:5-methylcytosine-specific restriction endonuclease McrBC GTP-binding regulatory subunit McrB
MIPYKAYEKAVFDWLMEKHNQDNLFTFSLRKKADKGAETDYFIGTENSSYFSTTFWTIPTAFPGSSADLLGVIFSYSTDKQLRYQFNFYQTNQPHNEQNRRALELIKNIKPRIKERLGLASESKADAQMEVYKTPFRKTYTDITGLLSDLASDLEVLVPIVDNEISKMKAAHPGFAAHRITQDEFNTFRNSLDKRTGKHDPSWKDIAAFLRAAWTTEGGKMAQFELGKEGYDGGAREKRKYVWVSDTDGIIGDEIAHYEIRWNDKVVQIELHFEGEAAQKAQFYEQIKALPDKFEWKDWFKSKSIAYKELFDVNADNLATQVKEALLYMDGSIGEEVRKILKPEFIKNRNSNMPHNLNQILFGPPGTGKTYTTISTAVGIIDPDFNFNQPRSILKEKFDELIEADRIAFVTFHQSMSYEDFIEGIKPKLEEEESNGIAYKIEDGIFKKMAVKAKYAYFKQKDIDITNISREDFFNIAYEEILSDLRMQLDLGKIISLPTKSGTTMEVTEVTTRDNIYLKHAQPGSDKEYTVSRVRLFKLFKYFTDLTAIKNIDKEFRTVIGGSNATAYWAVLNKFYSVFEKVKQKGFQQEIVELVDYDQIRYAVEPFSLTKELVDQAENIPYVLIIDEINRGNISQIFGELITLIEEDKRLGKEEALTVTLPYSKDQKFGVPPNLYIIGTMNTADRSVEALDTALRRRFSFEEMPPKPELLEPGRMFWELLWKYEDVKWKDPEYKIREESMFSLFQPDKTIVDNRIKNWDKFANEGKQESQIATFPETAFTGINLKELLKTINSRLEKLLDRDHLIGHSFFINVTGWDDLQVTFYNKIIPLLQEYFFGDYGKIGLVLGKGFVRKKEFNDIGFADFEDYQGATDFDQRDIFEIIDLKDNKEGFRKAIELLMRATS